MNRRPRRLHRWAKWVGLTACVISALALLSSFVFTAAMYRSGWGAVLGFGTVMVNSTFAEWGNPQHGWAFTRRLASDPIVYSWWVKTFSAPASVNAPGPVWWVVVPTWIPLVALAIPTVFLWRRDRRPPKGHCQTCGYNLAHNTSGVCPECGEKIKTG